ncbi:hypothetical protein B0T21DRAFT_136377 [Apiosordaria backusii]|uniref:Uncharacterized protein n=1 Tax=Apiosordaria backusii TaxID=314023 RepID=A0AA40BRI9_9PEZI|nr:hypothetical protein B0T21DRAFT_136377 [Apiosordaria backusii]
MMRSTLGATGAWQLREIVGTQDKRFDTSRRGPRLRERMRREYSAGRICASSTRLECVSGGEWAADSTDQGSMREGFRDTGIRGRFNVLQGLRWPWRVCCNVGDRKSSLDLSRFGRVLRREGNKWRRQGKASQRHRLPGWRVVFSSSFSGNERQATGKLKASPVGARGEAGWWSRSGVDFLGPPFCPPALARTTAGSVTCSRC